MILFVGEEDRGYFVRETAKLREEKLEFMKCSTSIGQQITTILAGQYDYIIFDVEQYVDAADDLAEEMKRIERAKNCTIIIYAPGYDPKSRVVQALMLRGIRYFVYAATSFGAREELERALAGYYKEPDEKLMEEATKKIEDVNGSIKIGITGACKRIGTTTTAIQFVKYLQTKGHKACYIEVNGTGFVEEHERNFNVDHDSYLGQVTFENVDMFYKQENLLEVFEKNYDYYIYDFGTYTDTDFNKTSFLEKDIRIFMLGSKASEMKDTMEVLRNEYYTDVTYMFNFISERERADLLEYMEKKAAKTFFTVYAPDQFEYVHNKAFELILPVKNLVEPEKKGLFGKKKKRKV